LHFLVDSQKDVGYLRKSSQLLRRIGMARLRIIKTVFIFGLALTGIGCGAKNQGVVINTSHNLAPLHDFGHAESCSPSVAWNVVHLPNQPVVTYDIAIYKATKGDGGEYDRGDGVFYREGYPETSVTVDSPLDAGKPYLWSIRVRLPDGKVSQWSTDSKTVKSPMVPAVYNTHWHGFVTPDNC
jgi:hypothetical protein